MLAWIKSLFTRRQPRTYDIATASFVIRPSGFLQAIVPLARETNPYNGDVRCPNDGEWVNIRCWACHWVRPEPNDFPFNTIRSYTLSNTNADGNTDTIVKWNPQSALSPAEQLAWWDLNARHDLAMRQLINSVGRIMP